MKKREIFEKIITSVLFICAVSSIGIVFFLVFNIIIQGHTIVIDWILNGFGTYWQENIEQFGILQFIFSTVYVGIGAMGLSALIGIPSAIYLAEFANPKIRNIIKPSMEMLVGIPSIALGFFGFLVIVQFLYLNFNFSTSIVAAWLVLAIMSLPHIATISEDSLRAVPNSYRNAALAVGATRWQTVRHIVLGSAKSGILASLLLALGNAMGETMAVFLVVGGVANPPISLDPTVKSNVMTRLIAVQYGETVLGSAHWQALFGVAFLLFIITFTLNFVITKIIRVKIQGNSRA